MFGNNNCMYNDTTCVPIVKYTPVWKENGRIEDNLFKSEQDLQNRINDDFISNMSKEFIEDRKKHEDFIKEEEEKRKTLFLKKKWFKIVDSLNRNYINVDVVDLEIAEEIKRCMFIPSGFLRTKLQKDCKQCSKEIWRNQERYKTVRHPNDTSLDFDGHFPEDHIKLINYVEKTDSEKNKYESMKHLVSYECTYVHD